jgi:CheY-like chemotaxis protein/HPt (histidine-containing phosphotransfer) domain-containing protein
MPLTEEPPAIVGLRQLRHDLLNPLNVLVGATRALRGTPLTETQQRWVRMLESSARQLQGVIDRMHEYPHAHTLDGQERLADLCSIAAARVSKPVDRARLLETLRALLGRSRARILLVDDSPEFAVLIRTYLADTGWELDVVDTGERAVAQATTERYDVVLMDIDLPGLDGATAAHAIRAADLARGASPTPVVAMTAFDTEAVTDLHIDPASASRAERRPEIDPEIAPLVSGFLDNRRVEVDALRGMVATGDFSAVQSTAHKLKGTGRGYGFPEISRIGADLESAAHHHDGAEARRLIDELEGYLRSVSAPA